MGMGIDLSRGEQGKLPRRRAGGERYGVDAPPAPEDRKEERSWKRGRKE